MNLRVLPGGFAICKLSRLPEAIPNSSFWFLSRTDEEISLVCRDEAVPDACLCAERNWRLMRVDGPLDFSLVGILAELSGVLSQAGVSLFAVSTYDTDYILVKARQYGAALDALRGAGHAVYEE